MRRNSRFSSGPLYADNDEYLAKRLIFTINAIEFQEKAGFENSDRWAVYVPADDGRPDEIITLSSNDKRDAELSRPPRISKSTVRSATANSLSPERPTTSATRRRPRAPSVSNDGGPAIALDRPSELVLPWQSVNQSREAVKGSARRHARRPNTSRGRRGKENRSRRPRMCCRPCDPRASRFGRPRASLASARRRCVVTLAVHCVRPKAVRTKPAPPTGCYASWSFPRPSGLAEIATRDSRLATMVARILERGPRLLADGRRR